MIAALVLGVLGFGIGTAFGWIVCSLAVIGEAMQKEQLAANDAANRWPDEVERPEIGK